MKRKCIILISIVLICISSIVCARYILRKSFDIQATTKPFYFEASAQQEVVELYQEATINLTIKNYISESEFNDFNTNYQITLENNDKFQIAVEDANSGTIASGKSDNQVTLTLTAVANASIKAREDIVLKITSTSPYNKEIRIALKVYMLGRYVQYDNRLWVIMYNDDVNGIQLISDNVLEPDNVWLGSKDTTIQNAVNETTQNKDLNGDGVIENMTLDNTRATVNNVEKAAYSYNNMIKILNTRCESLVTDKSKIAKNEQGQYLIRSVGTVPNDKDYEVTTMYTSNLLASWPVASANTGYSVGALNGKLKDMDKNWETDRSRMVELNLKIAYNSSGVVCEYWFGTRYNLINDTNTNTSFGGRFMSTEGALTRRRFFSITSSTVNIVADTTKTNYGVRPVINIDPAFEISGIGTKASPFVIK